MASPIHGDPTAEFLVSTKPGWLEDLSPSLLIAGLFIYNLRKRNKHNADSSEVPSSLGVHHDDVPLD